MKVEFLLAYEDKTWDTEIIDVPDNVVDWDDAVRTEVAGHPKYRKVVYWGIYNTCPEDMAKE